MPFPFDIYPWVNFHELNLAYFIKHFREIFQQWDELYNGMLEWKADTEEELETWKNGVVDAIDNWEHDFSAAIEIWKRETETDLDTWKTTTLAALDAWKTATTLVFEQIRTEAAASATAAAGSATSAETAKTAAQTAQAAAEAAAAGIASELAQIQANAADIADLQTEIKIAEEVIPLWYQGAIRVSNGTPNTVLSRICTKPCPKSGLLSVKANTGFSYLISIYANENVSSYIGTFENTSEINLTGETNITSIDDDKWIAFTLRHNDNANITPSDYTNFTVKSITNRTLNMTGFPADANSAGEKLKAIGDNLIIVSGAIQNGEFISAYSNAYLKVKPGSLYEIKANASASSPYGALKTLTLPPVPGTTADFSDYSGWTGARNISAGETEKGEIPADVNYLYFYVGADFTQNRLPEKIIINGVDIYSTIREQISEIASSLNKYTAAANKTLAFFGDSLVSGSGVTGTGDSLLFHQIIHELYDHYTCLNYGYGGSGYVRNATATGGYVGIGEAGRGVPLTNETKLEHNTVLSRLQAIANPSIFDAVVIFAGTNDWHHQSTYTYNDFVSALEETFSYYQTNFSSIPLLIMTPIHRPGDSIVSEDKPKTLYEYRSAIIEQCEKFGIPYIDTFTISGMNPDNSYNRTVFFYRDDNGTNDGVHCNGKGHKRLERAIGETLNQLVLWDTKITR